MTSHADTLRYVKRLSSYEITDDTAAITDGLIALTHAVLALVDATREAATATTAPALSRDEVADLIRQYGRECATAVESFRCAEPDLDAAVDPIMAALGAAEDGE